MFRDGLITGAVGSWYSSPCADDRLVSDLPFVCYIPRFLSNRPCTALMSASSTKAGMCRHNSRSTARQRVDLPAPLRPVHQITGSKAFSIENAAEVAKITRNTNLFIIFFTGSFYQRLASSFKLLSVFLYRENLQTHVGSIPIWREQGRFTEVYWGVPG
jgi:hypothetical protein